MNWRIYFEDNRDARLPIPWERGIDVEPHLRGPLIRSLRRFQVGESGDGAHLKACAAATGDAEYQQAIALFIAEEQHHAALMARILGEMGADLLDGHWSDLCFVLLRRVAGLHLELLVLMAAEMIAKRYFRALRDGTRDPVLQMIFERILRDEYGHVAFHTDYLRRRFAPMSPAARFLIRTGWRALFGAACLVVLFDHRGVLRAAGVSPRVFWRECHVIFDETAGGIFSPVLIGAPAESPLP